MDDRGTADGEAVERLKDRDRRLLADAGAPLHAITRIVNIAEREGCYRDGGDGLLSLRDAAESRGLLLRDLYGVGPSVERFIAAAVRTGGAR